MMNDLHSRQSQQRSSEFDVAGKSHVGYERSRNEDSFLIANLTRTLRVQSSNLPPQKVDWFSGSSAGTLLMVADGMGGYEAGDVASRVAVETTAGYLLNIMPWMGTVSMDGRAMSTLPGIRDQLAKAVEESDHHVREQGGDSLVGRRILGTTLTMAFVCRPFVYVAHVGDSRCYLLKRYGMSRLTTDHTVAEQLRARGVDDVNEATRHMLWNALGGGDETAPVPQVVKATLEPGDSLLLCSDGLTHLVSDDEIDDVLRRHVKSSDACDELIRLALERGGIDNVTCVICRIPQNGAT